MGAMPKTKERIEEHLSMGVIAIKAAYGHLQDAENLSDRLPEEDHELAINLSGRDGDFVWMLEGVGGRDSKPGLVKILHDLRMELDKA